MGVIQFPKPIPATNGNLPNLRFMVSTDNLATLTTAGYLNSTNLLDATPLSNGDVVLALYSYNTNTTSGTFGIFTVSINTATTAITLNEWTGTSGVVLPTIANHIATYTNTTGTLSEDPATAISGGNIQAGLSGTAGTLASFPGTASKGSLVVAAVANTGNTNTTISNAAMGQASVISIPDPGGATANFAVAPSALVNGNFVKASGTAGLIVDSGIPASTFPFVATVTLTAAQINGMYTTPVQLIAAQGAGSLIVVSGIAWDFIYGSAAFASGGLVTLQYGNTNHAGGTLITTGIAAASVNGVTANSILTDTVIPIVATSANTVNTGVFISNATGSFTTGTGTTTTLYVFYRVVAAS